MRNKFMPGKDCYDKFADLDDGFPVEINSPPLPQQSLPHEVYRSDGHLEKRENDSKMIRK